MESVSIPAGSTANDVASQLGNAIAAADAAAVASASAAALAAGGPDRQQQRRERSRKHAKRSRDKKKVLVETLEEEAKELQKENEQLRALIHSKLPDQAQAIVGECCYNHKHTDPLLGGFGDGADGEAGLGGADGGSTSRTKELVKKDFGLIESLTAGRQSFVLTDPRLPDNPIVYASATFCTLTGYNRDEVVGRNCRFLQGPETDAKAVERVRAAIANPQGRDVTVVLKNFKKDGTAFWNQFFVAALRDRHGNIVNYVGVQCETEEPKPDGKAAKSDAIPLSSTSNPAHAPSASSSSSMVNIPSPDKLDQMNMQVKPAQSMAMFDSDDEDDVDGLAIEGFDWSMLAEALETGYAEGEQEFEGSAVDSMADDDDNNMNTDAQGILALDEQPTDLSGYGGTEGQVLDYFVRSPRAFTTKTVRSEVIDSLLQSHGDTSDPRFCSALDLLASIYKASGQNACSSTALTDFLDGGWRVVSRPAYEGCLGLNDYGDFIYTLEKMSFGMFKPPQLRCSVQRTMSNIGGKVDGGAPALVPWSLRRELAVLDPDDGGANANANANAQPSAVVKSYDIAVSLTIEPGQINTESTGGQVFSPDARLNALKVVKGYMLPDPNTPNRLTVWFTGGKLSPAPPETEEDGMAEETRKAKFEQWKAVFGGEHKKSWTESFRDMGAKLFLGAELPDGMAKDGTMSYTLHRPHGGHGKAYVDIVYLDANVLITKGNRGTIYAMVRDSALPEGATATSSGVTNEAVTNEAVPDPLPSSSSTSNVPNPLSHLAGLEMKEEEVQSRKRKAVGLDVNGGIDGVDIAPVDDRDESNDFGRDSKIAKLSPSSAVIADSNNFFDLAMYQPLPSLPSNNAHVGATPFTHSVEHEPQQYSSDGIKHIMHSVESFFTGMRG